MIRPRKVPLRICVGCQEKIAKKSLLRIVRTPDEKVEVDLTGKKSGRGVYVCFRKECVVKAQKGRRLEKHLKHSIPEEVMENILGIIEEKTDNR